MAVEHHLVFRLSTRAPYDEAAYEHPEQLAQTATREQPPISTIPVMAPSMASPHPRYVPQTVLRDIAEIDYRLKELYRDRPFLCDTAELDLNLLEIEGLESRFDALTA